jgi:lysophospholipase L1-like esterase
MNTFTRACIFIAVFLLHTAAFSQAYKRVAVIGSSTAYGFFPPPSPPYSTDSGWVSKLQKYYQQLNIVDTVFNLGCLGRDCYSGMPTGYIPPPGENTPDQTCNITKAIAQLPKPDVILVNYPSNSYERLDNDSIIQCLRAIKDEANSNNIRCYIATTQPRNSFDSAGRQKLKDLRDLMLATFGTWAIDFFTPLVEEPSLNILPAYDLGDNIHINPEGHTALLNQVIAKNIFTTVLPVHFDYFKADMMNDKTMLQWCTSSEYNNSYFIVERSSNGRSFDPITAVNSRSNNSIAQAYQYADVASNLNGFFYRVAAISSTGNKQLSAVIFVPPIRKTFTVNALYPSPASNVIFTQIGLQGKKNIDVLVTDALGKKIIQQQVVANTLLQYQLDIHHLAKGNYFIRFSCNGQIETLGFYKQ